LKNKAVDSKQRKDYYRNDGRFSHDMKRQQFLESSGLTVLRFNDSDVKSDMDNILMAIQGWIENRGNRYQEISYKKTDSSNSPLRKGGQRGLCPFACSLLLTAYA
jgi:hypothetical protein